MTGLQCTCSYREPSKCISEQYTFQLSQVPKVEISTYHPNNNMQRAGRSRCLTRMRVGDLWVLIPFYDLQGYVIASHKSTSRSALRVSRDGFTNTQAYN